LGKIFLSRNSGGKEKARTGRRNLEAGHKKDFSIPHSLNNLSRRNGGTMAKM